MEFNIERAKDRLLQRLEAGRRTRIVFAMFVVGLAAAAPVMVYGFWWLNRTLVEQLFGLTLAAAWAAIIVILVRGRRRKPASLDVDENLGAHAAGVYAIEALRFSGNTSFVVKRLVRCLDAFDRGAECALTELDQDALRRLLLLSATSRVPWRYNPALACRILRSSATIGARPTLGILSELSAVRSERPGLGRVRAMAARITAYYAVLDEANRPAGFATPTPSSAGVSRLGTEEIARWDASMRAASSWGRLSNLAAVSVYALVIAMLLLPASDRHLPQVTVAATFAGVIQIGVTFIRIWWLDGVVTAAFIEADPRLLPGLLEATDTVAPCPWRTDIAKLIGELNLADYRGFSTSQRRLVCDAARGAGRPATLHVLRIVHSAADATVLPWVAKLSHVHDGEVRLAAEATARDLRSHALHCIYTPQPPT